MSTTWLGVWARAVLGPAWRRAAAVWGGTALVAAVIFGPTGMQPRDLTQLALHEPATALVLGVTWLLVFAPIARGVVHADAARFLRSLPAPRFAPAIVGALALVGMQLPWLALWTLGEGARGLAVVALTTLAIVLVALVRPVRRPRGAPRWRSPLRAFASLYLAALGRRAGDALARGAGLAILAGLAGGLFVRNNALAGAHAAQLAAQVSAIVLVPAHAGVLSVVLDAHRTSAWLAASLGVPPAHRLLALACALAVVHAAAALLALAGCALIAAPSAPTLGWLALASVACALASALGTARVVTGAARASALAHAAQRPDPSAARMTVGAFAVDAAIAALLGAFGVPTGLAAAVLAMAFLLGTARSA